MPRTGTLTRRLSTVAAIVGVAAVGLAAPVLAAPFGNGSFEPPDTGGGDYCADGSELGSDLGGGWTVTVDCLQVTNGSIWDIFDGTQSVDLSALGADAAAIEQTFDTVAGTSYIVSFAYGANPNDPSPEDEAFTVDVDGQVNPHTMAVTAPAAGPGTDPGWQTGQYFFQANGPSVTLTFAQTSPGDGYGVALDAVEVVVNDIGTNGSFEDPDNGEPISVSYPADVDPGAIPGWTIAEGCVEISSASPVGTPPDGDQVGELGCFMDAGDHQEALIEQTFPTQPDTNYTISWTYGANPCDLTERTGNMLINGVVQQSMAVTANASDDPNYQQASITVGGTGDPFVLGFQGTGDGDPTCSLIIDNVMIAEDTSVPIVDPEVAAALIALAGVAVGGVVWTRRRRRNAAAVAA